MEAESSGMKRKFSLNKITRRGIGQTVAASVMALAVAISGAGATALLATQSTGLTVEPAVSLYTTKEYGSSTDANTQSEAEAEQAASDEESAACSTQQAETAAKAPEKAASQQQTQAESDADAQPSSVAAADDDVSLGLNIDEENDFPVLQQETEELAAEDPMSAPASNEENTHAEQAAEEAEDNPIMLTPEQIQQALDSGAIDAAKAEGVNIDDENDFLNWLWNWFFGWTEPSSSSTASSTASSQEQQKYSGWKTINGKTYYYSQTTNKAYTGIHSIDGKLYYFDANGVMQNNVTFGIDVSKYQKNIDWDKVKQAGAQFVMIRIGYRGYSSGALVLDPMFEEHFTNARNAGLRVGVYFFSQATTEQEAQEEAQACITALNGRGLDYPIYFDSESSGSSSAAGRADGLGATDRTKCAVAFCEQVKASGYRPGVYAATRWFNKRLNMSSLNGYSIWNAHYDVANAGLSCDIWQGSCTARINGYNGDIDVNISYIG